MYQEARWMCVRMYPAVVRSAALVLAVGPAFGLAQDLAVAVPAHEAELLDTAAVSEPDGFRQSLYDAPVPPGLRGAITVNAAQVRRLQQDQQAVVIDVIPESRQPEGLSEDELWLPVPHRGVPGALWLPDTGFGTLHATTIEYFSYHLSQATKGDAAHPLVFYCRADCWMSWNAAKRALHLGYTRVYWFRDGIDDWLWEEFKVDILKPAPGQRMPGDK